MASFDSLQPGLQRASVTDVGAPMCLPLVVVNENSRQFSPATKPSPRWAPSAWSVALHLGILLALMCWQLESQPAESRTFDVLVDTTVEDSEPVRFTALDLTERILSKPTDDVIYGVPGGRAGNGAALNFAPVAAPTIGVPVARQGLLASVLSENWSGLSGLSDRVAVAGPTTNRVRRNGSGAGSGNGTGNGVGDGSATEFFGVAPLGKRIVYVLDSSKSMNRPHDSEAGTRFKRVKLELLESIASLPEESTFFILFFNDYCVSMPAPGLEAATLGAKQKYLTWMQQVIPVGNTEPTAALERALRMRPDLIYFLSDGDFDAQAREALIQLPVTNAKLQTIAFEEPLSDDGLRAMELIQQNKIAAAQKLVTRKEFLRVAAAWRGEKFLKELSERHHGNLVLVP